MSSQLFRTDFDRYNPIKMMTDSGARGNIDTDASACRYARTYVRNDTVEQWRYRSSRTSVKVLTFSSTSSPPAARVSHCPIPLSRPLTPDTLPAVLSTCLRMSLSVRNDCGTRTGYVGLRNHGRKRDVIEPLKRPSCRQIHRRGRCRSRDRRGHRPGLII